MALYLIPVQLFVWSRLPCAWARSTAQQRDLTIGVIVCGMGVFRYNQVAGLAREGARWASVRGREYQNNAHRSRVTSEDVVSEVIRKKSVALDPKRLQCEVTWGPNDTTVSVTLRYEWIPGVSGQGGVFQSTAVMFVSY